MDIASLYNENKEFKDYVDKYSANYHEGKSIPVEEALKHKLIVSVAELYYSGDNKNIVI